MNPSHSSRPLATALVAAFITLSWAAANAQELPGTAGNNRQIISVNPVFGLFGVFSAEYERKATDVSSWGLSTSMFGFGGKDYLNGSAFYRVYPSGNALAGFYLGGRGGVHRVAFRHDSGVFYGVGFDLGYTWLLGRHRNVGISLGVGATRLFGGALDDVALVIPNIRVVNVGWSF